jgi:hypothetical protein
MVRSVATPRVSNHEALSMRLMIRPGRKMLYLESTPHETGAMRTHLCRRGGVSSLPNPSIHQVLFGREIPR